MLPLDLLNELITLLDDASTYRSFALASRITSQLCRKGTIKAKKTFGILKSNYHGWWYRLPDGTCHGPELNRVHQSYCIYLDGKREGRFEEWYNPTVIPSRYVTCWYREGTRHGVYTQWDGIFEKPELVINFTHGTPQGPYEECGRGMRMIAEIHP